MEELTKAYLAGILDGEGWISIIQTGDKRKRSIYHRLVVGVVMTDKPIIRLLQSSLGGSFYQHSKESKQRKGCWGWRVFASQASQVLKLLLPYLRVKKPQALLAIDFRESWKDQRGGKGYKKGGVCCLPQVLAERKKYCVAMHRLNSRRKR